MNLIEAVKSGKFFRRKSWVGSEYYDNSWNDEIYDTHDGVAIGCNCLGVEDILAEDWEVKDEP